MGETPAPYAADPFRTRPPEHIRPLEAVKYLAQVQELATLYRNLTGRRPTVLYVGGLQRQYLRTASWAGLVIHDELPRRVDTSDPISEVVRVDEAARWPDGVPTRLFGMTVRPVPREDVLLVDAPPDG
jgi:hypothetical protein